MNRIDFWSFDLQQTIFHSDLVIQPGDRINLHCIYDTMSRKNNTVFGPASNNEMCLDFVYYYPKVEGFTSCGYWRNAKTETTMSICSLATQKFSSWVFTLEQRFIEN